MHNFEFKALSAKKGCGTESDVNGMLWNYIVWDRNGESMTTDDTEDPGVDPDAPKYVGGSFSATPSMFTEGSEMDILWGKTVTLNISNMTREALITGKMPAVEVTSDDVTINDVMALFDGAEVMIDNAAYVITNDGTDNVLVFSMKPETFATAETDYDSLFVTLEDEEGTSYDVFDIQTITALKPLESDTPEPPLPGEDDLPTAEELEVLDELIEAAETLATTKVDTDAANVDKGEKWVTQETMDALLESLEIAKKIRETEEVTKDAVVDATEDLAEAIDAFGLAVQTGTKEEEVEPPVTEPDPDDDVPTAGQLQELDEAIEEAEGLAADTLIDTDAENVNEDTPWVTQETMDALLDAIDEAKAVREAEEVTGTEVEEAIATLKEAIDTFNDAVQVGTKSDTEPPVVEPEPGEDEDAPTEEQLEALDRALTNANSFTGTIVDTDAENVEKGLLWVTQETMDALLEAIASAQEVKDNDEATGAEVEEATNALKDAVETFNEAVQFGTKEDSTLDPDPDTDEPTEERLEALRSAIADAEELKDTLVDTDAENVDEGEEWVTEETMTALTTAIQEAKTALDDEEATGTSIDEAIEALVNAINNFNAAKQIGTKTEPEEPDTPVDENAPTEEQIEALDAAIAEGQELQETQVAETADEVAEGDNWVTQDVMDELTDAVTAAITVRAEETSTGEDYETATQSLNEAIESFKVEIQVGTGTTGEEPEEPEETE